MKVGEKLKNIFLEAAMNYDKIKELRKLAKEEKEEYKRNKNAFYADPIHWNNNKRRRYGLPVLRGNVNKYRSKTYLAFHPSVNFFGLLDDIITEIIEDSFKTQEYFNSFVEVKKLVAGDAKVFRMSE